MYGTNGTVYTALQDAEKCVDYIYIYTIYIYLCKDAGKCDVVRLICWLNWLCNANNETDTTGIPIIPA